MHEANCMPTYHTAGAVYTRNACSTSGLPAHQHLSCPLRCKQHRGLPFLMPRRICCTSNMHWMTRAGPTALRMNPTAKAKVAGMPKMATASPPSKKASSTPGIRSRRTAAGPTRLKICSQWHKVNIGMTGCTRLVQGDKCTGHVDR
jgi:hypothetical protein